MRSPIEESEAGRPVADPDDAGMYFVGPYPACETTLRRLARDAHADFAMLTGTREGIEVRAGVVARTDESTLLLLYAGGPEPQTLCERSVVAADGSTGTLRVGSYPGSEREARFARHAESALAAETGVDADAATFAWPTARVSVSASPHSLLESVVVHANDAILITEALPIDEPGPRVVFVNGAYERMTGYSASEIAGTSPRLMQGPLTSADSRRRIREALESWRPIEVEIVNHRRDGTPFWVELSLVPVADASGWYRHWISIQRDVTARRAAAALESQIETVLAQNTSLAEEIANRQDAEVRLERFAFSDVLTGLRNRAYFIERLTLALSKTDRSPGRAFAVLFFDLDRFKIVNDSLGHSAGDRLLREVGARVRRCVRDSEVAARMGGDEFAVLVEEIEGEHVAVALAERIVAVLREPVVIGDVSVSVHASVGVAYRTVDGTTAEAVLRDADIAMYRAKEQGGNRCVVFDEAMHAKALSTFRLHADLQRALQEDEIVAHFQPIVELATGALRGFEALARWNHPTRGLVPPDEFIPAAEESGFIVKIGNCVLRRACNTMKQWQDLFPATAAPYRISVNVSPVQLQDALFFDSIVAALDEAGLSGRSLELEITEGVFLDDTNRANELFERLHALGVTIAIDDFGTGYSSMRYLQRYRIDVLKIDRSFISTLTESRRNAELVRTMIDLGRILDMSVLAEGVETLEQRTMLLGAGCRLAQGYYYAKPMSPDDASEYLRASIDRPPAAA